MRTILRFRQEEFIQKGEVKVILKEQNAGQAVLHQSAVPKEIWNYKTLRRTLRRIRCKKEEPIITGDSKR